MKSLKSKKMGSLFTKEVSKIILEEVKEPKAKEATITGCDVTNDLSFAKVYFTVLDRSTKEEVEHRIHHLLEDYAEIVSKDGLATKSYTLIVTRAAMNYTVVSPDSLYTLTKDANRAGYATLDLIDMPATAINDYTKAISFDKNKDDLKVEVLSEINSSTNEVIIKVTNNQNPNEVEYVHLVLNTTATATGSMFDIIFWIILGLAVILLVIILICVNRDKYGSVSKSRKHA